ncbi:Protein O-linked-mannose beta-1,2-N-acetylglucosaminyltransferase 1 [Toxocara canis]|uniref:Protein O-linked-mannose beta-1,2-N-acetylglucosaminyltransferase 1 n=1 Tax=Toxocara canis TaxID=6265 RepID=A0A0B2UUE3_TOXCA|nr:Protein O-linked-mannose beta-1,2-N-acetylglucosaminyltransferase 1 [Toxocara canis]
MPRVSTLRRLGIAVFAVLSVYVVTRTLLLPTKDIAGSKPFRPVRSKFHVESETSAVALAASVRSKFHVESETSAVALAASEECRTNHSCQSPRLFIWMKSESRLTPPLICINGLKLFKEAELVNGFSAAVLNGDGPSAKTVRHIPLTNGDGELLEFLAQISTPALLILASHGDVADKLSAEARQLLNLFGGSSLSNYTAGTSLLFVGQSNSADGKAEEWITELSISKRVEYSACLGAQAQEQLLDKIREDVEPAQWIDDSLLPELSGMKSDKAEVALGKEMPNCGILHKCKEDEIPMSFYTGVDKNDSPSLCVNDHFVIDRGVNDAGRGLNLVVVDSKTHRVTRCGHFDTYDQGLNMNNIRLCLESVYEQEGLNPRNVVVAFDSSYPEVLDLSALFRVRSLPLNTSSSYSELLVKSLSQMMSAFPSSPCFIVIEEDVLLAPDFLYFLDQILPTFLDDPSVSTILTFNRNGITKSSSLPSAVYRVENVTLSSAFLIKRSAYEKFIANRGDVCCSENVTDGWRLPGYAYMPDMSRVKINAPNALDIVDDSRRKLFTESRIATKYGNETVTNVERLKADVYDADLKLLIERSRQVKLEGMADCQPGSLLDSPIKVLNLTSGQSFSIFYSGERGTAEVLARCFHLFCDRDDVIFGTYKGVTRFSVNGHPAFLVNSTNIFGDHYKHFTIRRRCMRISTALEIYACVLNKWRNCWKNQMDFCFYRIR